ncbi:MAG: HAMP domain-containing histidine kinase, partial [Alphaproteobacteria bacterium]
LKTPLSALKSQSQRLRDADHAEAADAMDRAIGTMTAVIEGQLARSRVATGSGHSSDARDIAEHLISVLEQTANGERIVFTNAINAAVALPVSRETAMEMLGPLLENATRFARRQVVISATVEDGRLVLTVDDDGPGIAADQLAAAFGRGARLDETSAGHGLGLTIARDLAAASNGQLTLTRSIHGGLSARIAWSSRG